MVEVPRDLGCSKALLFNHVESPYGRHVSIQCSTGACPDVSQIEMYSIRIKRVFQ